MSGLMAFGLFINILKFILIIVAFIVIIIVCISIERTKNETIRVRELLENINKIEIARYKKEFGIANEKKSTDETIDEA